MQSEFQSILNQWSDYHWNRYLVVQRRTLYNYHNLELCQTGFQTHQTLWEKQQKVQELKQKGGLFPKAYEHQLQKEWDAFHQRSFPWKSVEMDVEDDSFTLMIPNSPWRAEGYDGYVFWQFLYEIDQWIQQWEMWNQHMEITIRHYQSILFV